MNLSTMLSVSDWNAIQAASPTYAEFMASIAWLETNCGRIGAGRDWYFGFDYYPGAAQPQYKGFANQVAAVSAFVQNCSLPISQATVLEFSRSYWKAGSTDADRVAWANGVWGVLAGLVDDLSNAWLTQTPAAAVKSGLWTNVPSLSNMQDPAFVLALIAQTGLSALQALLKAAKTDPRLRFKYKLIPATKEQLAARKQFRDVHDAVAILKTAPASFYWPTLPARDQGAEPDCTGFGNADMIDRLVAYFYGEANEAAEVFITSALEAFEGGGGNDQGGYTIYVLDFIEANGLAPETDWPISILTPENIDNLPAIPANVLAAGSGQKISGSSVITTADELKAALLTAPVSFDVAVYSNGFENAAGGVILAPNSVAGDTLEGYHNICFDGYDDTKQLAGFSTPGAFRFANSWGPDWGDNGYGWIHPSLITNTKLMTGMYSVTPAITVPNQPQPNPPAPPTPPAPSTEPIAIFTCGENQAIMNGVAVPIDSNPAVTPILVDQWGRVFVPLRFTQELIVLFGGKATMLTWDASKLQATQTESASGVNEFIEVLPGVPGE